VDDPESAPNLRLGRVSHTSAYLSARKEGRFSNSPWRTMSDLLSLVIVLVSSVSGEILGFGMESSAV
jgi:hypothetical protein